MHPYLLAAASHTVMQPGRGPLLWLKEAHRVSRLTHCILTLQNQFHSCAGIILTNDGNAILREIDVSHPAAKVVIWQAV